jgi:hypothetical protein
VLVPSSCHSYHDLHVLAKYYNAYPAVVLCYVIRLLSLYSD